MDKDFVMFNLRLPNELNRNLMILAKMKSEDRFF